MSVIFTDTDCRCRLGRCDDIGNQLYLPFPHVPCGKAEKHRSVRASRRIYQRIDRKDLARRRRQTSDNDKAYLKRTDCNENSCC